MDEPGKEETSRTFLAFEVPEYVREFVERLRESMCEYGIVGNWTPPENLHATLLFLGGQSESELYRISDAVEKICAATSAFEMECAGVGSFHSSPRLLFANLASDPPRAFAELALELREQLLNIRVRLPADVCERDPLPHVTLVRFRHSGEGRKVRRLGTHCRPLWSWSKPLPELPDAFFKVSQVKLFKSVPQADSSPRYEVLKTFDLH